MPDKDVETLGLGNRLSTPWGQAIPDLIFYQYAKIIAHRAENKRNPHHAGWGLNRVQTGKIGYRLCYEHG